MQRSRGQFPAAAKSSPRIRRALKVLLALSILGSISYVAILGTLAYRGFTEGTTPGPDLVARLQDGSLRQDDVESIEIFEVFIEPATHSPYNPLWMRPEDYPALATLRDRKSMGVILHDLEYAISGIPEISHPSTTSRVFMRIHTAKGWYWVKAQVLSSATQRRLAFGVGNLNATSIPSGNYYRGTVGEFLTLLKELKREQRASLQGDSTPASP